MASQFLSIIVPVYNEAESLDALVDEIGEVAREHDLDVEIVLIDDGSRDSSWSRIVEHVTADQRVAGIRFRRNYGKAAALMAGFRVARGERVVMMDADLQDPPAEIPRLLAKIGEGWDVVSGWKQNRHDPWHKVYPSRVFNAMIGWLTGVRLHDHVCGLKCMRREVAENLRIHGELHRFIGVFAAARGFRVTELPTLHRPRTHGRSKYGFTRFFKGFLDLMTVCFLTRFSWRPQHLIGMTGIVLTILCCAGLLLGSWGGDAAGIGRTLVMLTGILTPLALLVAIGLVAEWIVAHRPLEDLYEVSECTGWCAGGDQRG